MTITRIINGETVKIELTDGELGEAFREWQHLCDIELAASYWDYKSFHLTDEEAETIATKAREELDYNDFISETRWNVVSAVGLRVLDPERVNERDSVWYED